jgi:WD40 repeat protein
MIGSRPLQLALLALPLLFSATQAAPPITALAVNADGSILAIGRPRSLGLFRPGSKEPTQSHPLPLPKVTHLAFESTGQRLWVAGGTPGESGLVLALDLPSLAEARRIPVDHDLVQAVAPSPDNRWIAWTDGADLHVESLVPDPAALSSHRLLRGHSARVLGLAWSPDSSLLTSVASDRAVKVWTTTQTTPLRTFSQHTEAPNGVAFQPGAPVPTCATGGDDRTVRVWQPGIGRMVRIVRNHEAAILALAYAPDGRQIYTADASGHVRRIDAASDEVLGSWRASEDWIHALVVHPRNEWIATGDAAGVLRLWTPQGTAIPLPH